MDPYRSLSLANNSRAIKYLDLSIRYEANNRPDK